jgi:quercetin dioxygenase-like cupin family protein
MHAFRDDETAWEPADTRHFTGSVRLKRTAVLTGGAPVKVYLVEFQAGARTHWHFHTGRQLLFIVEGLCRFAKWGEAPQEAGPGDMIAIEPGEKHWHGAAPGGRMAHFAVNVDLETTWLEGVDP